MNISFEEILYLFIIFGNKEKNIKIIEQNNYKYIIKTNIKEENEKIKYDIIVSIIKDGKAIKQSGKHGFIEKRILKENLQTYKQYLLDLIIEQKKQY